MAPSEARADSVIASTREQIRVLHCIHSLNGGGAERQLKLLIEASAQHDMTPGVFCVNGQANDFPHHLARVYKSRRGNKYNVSVFASLSQAVRDFCPDIIHAWLPASLTIPAMLVAVYHGLPCVFSYRGSMFFRRPLTIPEYACAWLAASRVISNNPVTQSHKLYQSLYRRKQGVVIKNAVAVDDQFRKTVHRDSALQTRSILFAGRITYLKNWPCLLEGFALALSKQNVELIVCGEGEDIPAFQNLIDQLNIRSHVRLLGYCEDLYEIMKRADIFVLPSWSEGMANSFLEALAIGLPCVVSSIAANLEVIGATRCALTFDPRSPEQLAECLMWLIDHPEQVHQMVQAGWKVADGYSPNTLAREHRNVYVSLSDLARRGHNLNKHSVHVS